MYDFSIEHNAHKIISPETKLFFKEVTSSYFNENHRAAVVTLYSVVIVDILNKLETLVEMYSDVAAEGILVQIRDMQAANAVGSEWEKVLIEETKTRTNLLNTIDYSRILALKNDRHLCAHPVLDRGDKLYTPNRETVAAHIRNMLESVLHKPAILSKKILSTILIDISANEGVLLGNQLERYVQSKYFVNLDSLTEVMLFRDLWKFVFRLEDDNSSQHRLLNYRLLNIIYRRNFVICNEKIKQDKKYYGNIANSSEILFLIVDFFARYGELYDEFNDDFKLIVKSFIDLNPSAKVISWYIESNLSKHLDKLKKDIVKDFGMSIAPFDGDPEAYNLLIEIAQAKGLVSEITDFISWRYRVVRSYDEADRIFNFIIRPNIEKLSNEQLEILCEDVNKNGQAYGRKKAADDHMFLQECILKKTNGAAFPFNLFRNVFK